MNPDFRKVALIAASLGLVVSLFFALRSDEEPAATTTAMAATTATLSNDDTVVTVTFTISVSGDTAPAVKRFEVARGRNVKLVVESDFADEVHVHGYDVSGDVAPGAPATLTFAADAPGRFEIELEERGLEIGELEVRP